MAKKLTDFLKQLATKAGMSEDPTLVALLSNEQIGSIEIPEEFFTGVDNRLLSLNSALDNHPEVKKKYTAQALNGIDSQLKTYVESISDFDDATRSAILGEESSYKKLSTLFSKIEALKSAKAGADTDKDKVALQKKIEKLQQELHDAKGAIETTKTQYEKKLTDDKIDYRLRGLLTNVKTTLDSLPADVRQDTILNIVNKHLQGNGLVLKFDEKGDLQPYSNDGSKHFGANHTVTTMPALIDSLLAQNKLIPVSNPQNGQTQNHNNGQQNNGQTFIEPGKQNNGQDPKIDGTNQAVANMNAELLKSLTATTSN
jgi:hypothetical protein